MCCCDGLRGRQVTKSIAFVDGHIGERIRQTHRLTTTSPDEKIRNCGKCEQVKPLYVCECVSSDQSRAVSAKYLHQGLFLHMSLLDMGASASSRFNACQTAWQTVPCAAVALCNITYYIINYMACPMLTQCVFTQYTANPNYQTRRPIEGKRKEK